MGRGTYDYWVDYWPSSEVEPFASFVNRTTKHVITSTRPAEPWANSRIVDTAPIDYVQALKRQEGGDVGVHGSITLAQSLLRLGLVDELRLVVAPTLAGGGRRLFEGSDVLQRFQLLESASTPAGNLLLAYGTHPPT